MCISDVVSRASPGIRCIIGKLCIILSKVARYHAPVALGIGLSLGQH